MKHTFRGALTAWMALIVLQTVGTSGGTGKITSLLADLNGLIGRALSPDVAAIPDRRGGAASGGRSPGTAIAGPNGTGANGSHGYIDPNGRYIPPSDSTTPAPSAGTTHSDSFQGYAPSFSPLNA